MKEKDLKLYSVNNCITHVLSQAGEPCYQYQATKVHKELSALFVKVEVLAAYLSIYEVRQLYVYVALILQLSKHAFRVYMVHYTNNAVEPGGKQQ